MLGWSLYNTYSPQCVNSFFCQSSFAVYYKLKGIFQILAHLGSVHITPDKFENGSFTLKTHQMFSVHSTPEEFKNATITGRFAFVFEETRAGKSHDYRDAIVLEKLRFLKCAPSTRKWKPGVFRFLRFEERFRKAPFSWRISVDGRRNRRSKTAFFKFTPA